MIRSLIHEGELRRQNKLVEKMHRLENIANSPKLLQLLKTIFEDHTDQVSRKVYPLAEIRTFEQCFRIIKGRNQILLILRVGKYEVEQGGILERPIFMDYCVLFEETKKSIRKPKLKISSFFSDSSATYHCELDRLLSRYEEYEKTEGEFPIIAFFHKINEFKSLSALIKDYRKKK